MAKSKRQQSNDFVKRRLVRLVSTPTFFPIGLYWEECTSCLPINGSVGTLKLINGVLVRVRVGGSFQSPSFFRALERVSYTLQILWIQY
jgi:hypothetical protein